MKTNADRILGVVCALLVIMCIVAVFKYFSFSLSWFILLGWIVGMWIWLKTGLIKIEVGWKGQLLSLGERKDYIMNEGWHWIPFPFTVKTTDCRQTVVKLDVLEKIITRDNIQVSIEGSIIREIFDLNKYFGVEESGIKDGLDDIWDETIRTQVADKDLTDVLKMHAELGEEAHTKMGKQATENWGIKILRVVISSVKPDSKVAEDLALRERENLQREGQIVEFKHFGDRVLELMTLPPAGPGLSREQAIEQVQLALGKATKNIDAKTISIDAATAGLIGSLFGGKKP